MTSGTLIRQARTAGGALAGRAVGAKRQGSGSDRPLGARCRAAEPRDAARALAGLRLRPRDLTLVPYRGRPRATRRGCRRRCSGRRRSGCRRCSKARGGCGRDTSIRSRCCRRSSVSGSTYVVIGGLGRVIHGSDELTDGIDIVPSMREENLRRLGLALDGAERAPPRRQAAGAGARPGRPRRCSSSRRTRAS